MNVASQRGRLLQCGEVATSGHFCPSDHLEYAFNPLARRADDFLGKARIAKRRSDCFTRIEPKWLSCVLLVYAKCRSSIARKPVNGNIGQQLIDVESLQKFIATVAPREELLQYPGCQPARGIDQGVGKRLRLGALNVAITSFACHPLTSASQPLGFIYGKRPIVVLQRRLVAPGNKIQMQRPHGIRIAACEPGTNASSNVPALGEISRVAQLCHQPVPNRGNDFAVGAWRAWCLRKPEAGQ